MARVSAGELVGRLEKGKPVPAILLLGEEPYLRDSCRAMLIERFVPEAARTWAVSRYSADRGGDAGGAGSSANDGDAFAGASGVP